MTDRPDIPEEALKIRDCERCEGKGHVFYATLRPGEVHWYQDHAFANRESGWTCPDCNGTGKQSPAEPQDDVVEVLARLEYEAHLPGMWNTPGCGEPTKDDYRARARRHLAAITPLLPGPSYALEVKERVEAVAALGRLAAYADYSRVEEDEGLVRKALSGHNEGDEMGRKPSFSLGVIDHLRKEGEARPNLADGPIASLKVYAESNDEEVAKAAREALAALDGKDSDD